MALTSVALSKIYYFTLLIKWSLFYKMCVLKLLYFQGDNASRLRVLHDRHVDLHIYIGHWTHFRSLRDLIIIGVSITTSGHVLVNANL